MGSNWREYLPTYPYGDPDGGERMQPLFTMVFLTIVAPLVILFTAKWLWRLYILSTSDRENKLPLPPGDFGLPFVGEMLHFALDAVLGRDFFTRRRLRYGHVFSTHVMGRPTVRVVGADHVKRLLLTDAASVDMTSPRSVQLLLGPRALSNCAGAAHRRQRRAVLKAFTTDALSGYTSGLDRIVHDQLRQWADAGHVTVFDMAEKLALRAAWEVLVGMRDFEKFEDRIAQDYWEFLRGFWTLPLNIPGTTFFKGMAAKTRLTELIKEQYRKRKAEDFEAFDYQDVLSFVLEKEEESAPLSEEEVVDIIRELLFAGHSTTSSALTSIVMYLGQNRSVLEKLRLELADHQLLEEGAEITYEKIARLTYLGDVINETLRLAPPVGGGFRKATKTIEMDGYQIPKGWSIIWSIFDTHEVTERFERDRYAFRPERWEALRNSPNINTHYIPFGLGQRACVGKDYAKVLLRVFTAHLVRGYDWRLQNPDVKMARLPVRYPKDKLPATFTLRSSSSRSETLKNGSPSSCEESSLYRGHAS